MKLNLNDVQKVCSKLSSAISSDGVNPVTDAIEVKVDNGKANFSVTSLVYTVTATFDVDTAETFHTAVSAELFTKLISQLTDTEVELTCDDGILVVKSNGTYKLPMMYSGEDVLSIPEFELQNVTHEFELSLDALKKIAYTNSRELSKGVITNPVQKMYYVDSKGCITFTTGACLTDFTIPDGLAFLLTDKLVNIFKLIEGTTVKVKFGTDTLANGISQNKIILSTDDLCISAILNSDSALLSEVPKDIIRNMASEELPYMVTVNTSTLLSAINRLLLFMPKSFQSKPYGRFEFKDGKLNIYDKSDINVEQIEVDESSVLPDTETSLNVDFNDMKVVLEAVKDKSVCIDFGNNKSILIKYSGATNIIPECIV